jgi:hypothetical protein
MCNRKLLRTLQLLLFFALLVYFPSFGQVRWDGGAGDGQWMTAGNWTGDVLPAVTDDVILDNAFMNGNFTVSLPAGNSAVHIKSITIMPGSGNNIELILPATNTAIPAFKVSGAVYGMVIGNGGIFRNSSGADDGQPVQISDTLKINNGGLYIQNSASSHAAVAMVLSKAPGTEQGVFEFDVPAASSTISLSSRTYGKLVFSSNAMNGAVTYTATGINAIRVNSDLQTGTGVTLSLNFSDTLFIGRDMIQQGGVINLGNSSRKMVTVINRHLLQSSTGTISETGTALPEIVFSGNLNQQIDCKGAIKNSITLIMNNTVGATLMSPLSLPYMLKLKQGKITTTTTNILTLLPGCGIVADSLLNNSFIDGPLRKEGLSGAAHFLFPVGKGTTMRWLALKNASGHFNVEFFKSNPQQISSTYGSGIHHISNIEYWTIHADAIPSPSAAIELSFNDPNSLGSTDLSTVRVARLNSGTWMNAGNTAVTGTAGSRGSVISNMLSGWSATSDYFSLASSVAANSPLSLRNDTISMIPPNSNYTRSLQLLSVSMSNPHVLSCWAAESGLVKLYILDIGGRLVKIITAFPGRGINRLPIDVSSLPPGVYSIQGFGPKRRSNVLQFVR